MPPKGSKRIYAPILDNDSGAELEGAIRRAWVEADNDIIATAMCQAHYDTNKYHLSLESYRRLRESLGLIGVRKENWTMEKAWSILQLARERHPNAGIQEMRNIVRTESNNGTKIPRSIVHDWMCLTEPEQLEARKRRTTKRRQYYSSGSNEIWSMDQHDKWKRFGLWLHVGLDVFSGRILWLKVWWTNSNPRLICKYYLDAITDPEINGMPLLTFSDPGSENFGIANAQSTLRQMLDPTLAGTMQHKWMRKHCNIKPEIFWSQLRARFSPPLEAIMQEGIQHGWYNPHNYIELLVFRWVWMPLIQRELNLFAYRYNTSRKRSNTKTLLPHGRPKYIFEFPEQFDGQNYKVAVPSDVIEDVRKRYADPDHAVHDWVPVDFDNQARHAYDHYHLPPVDRTTAWHCYHTLLWYFTQVALTGEMHQVMSAQGEMQANLLAQSETGSSRGDAWAYELDGEVGYYDGENDFPVGDFSGDEGDDEADVAGDGLF